MKIVSHRILTLVSSLAMLTVLGAAHAALQAHWPLDTNGTDSSGNSRHLSLSNGAAIKTTAGQFIIGSGALGGNGPSGNMDGSDDRALANGTAAGAVAYYGVSGSTLRTVSFWVNGVTGGDANATCVSWGDQDSGGGERFDTRLLSGGGIRQEFNNGFWQAFPPPNVKDTNWHHVMVVLIAPGTSASDHRLFEDGKEETIDQVGGGAQTVNTLATWPLVLGDSVIDDAGVEFARNLSGWLDDVGIWDDSTAGNGSVDIAVSAAILNGLGQLAGLGISDLSTAQGIWLTGTPASMGGKPWRKQAGLLGVQGDYGGSFAGNTAYVVLDNLGNGIGLASKPIVTTDPQSQTNLVGTTASFSVTGYGEPTLSYSWLKNGSPIGGANSTNYVIPSVVLGDAGNYQAVISNSSGSTTSLVAVLTVLGNTPPFITAQPTNVTVPKGDPADLLVGADGTAPLAYQWRKNGTPQGGATTNPYNIPSTAYSDAGNWDVVVSNSFGSITSDVAVVTILDVTPPVISNTTNVTVAAAGPGGTVVSLAHVTAFDDKDGAVAVSLNPASGSLFPPGVTVVTATATDSSTNTSTSYFSVFVQGTAASQTLLTDNYTVSGQSDDINFEYTSGSRQGGLLAPIPYAQMAKKGSRGEFESFTQVGSFSYPGTLYMSTFNPDANVNRMEATLGHDFTESPSFSIEVLIHPDVGGSSNDWAGLSWGTTRGNILPDATVTGMGILTRSDGNIQVFDGGTKILDGAPDYLAPGGLLPAGPYTLRIEVQGTSFGGGHPAIVKGFVNGNQIRLNAGSLEHVKTSGFANNLITLSSFAGSAGSHDSTFDNLNISAVPTIFASRPAVSTVSGNSDQTFTLTVPASLVATSAVSVTVSSSDASVASMVGAVGGNLTLNYSMGGGNSQTVTVTGVAQGSADLSLSTTSPVPVAGPVSVKVQGLPLHIANFGFENAPLPGFPGFGSLSGWVASDTNWNGVTANLDAGGSLANNGWSGDGSFVAFLDVNNFQASGDQQISTTMSNLTPAQTYTLTFEANVAQGGGGAGSHMAVLLNGSTELVVAELRPVNSIIDGYWPVGLTFTAAGTTATLAISNRSVQVDGSRLLLDNIQLLPGNPPMWSQAAWTGDADSGVSNTNTYTHAYSFGGPGSPVINGVTFTGLVGGNPSVSNVLQITGLPAVFNNGTINITDPASAELAANFIYNTRSSSITMLGLEPGAKYRTSLYGVGWQGDTEPGLRMASFYGQGDEVFTVDETATFGIDNGIRVQYEFTATDTSETIRWNSISRGTYHLAGFANCLVSGPPILTIVKVGNQARISWPATLSGEKLQSSANVNTGYTDVGITPSVVGNEKVVFDNINFSGNRYYKLVPQ